MLAAWYERMIEQCAREALLQTPERSLEEEAALMSVLQRMQNMLATSVDNEQEDEEAYQELDMKETHRTSLLSLQELVMLQDAMLTQNGELRDRYKRLKKDLRAAKELYKSMEIKLDEADHDEAPEDEEAEEPARLPYVATFLDVIAPPLPFPLAKWNPLQEDTDTKEKIDNWLSHALWSEMDDEQVNQITRAKLECDLMVGEMQKKRH